MTVCIAAIAESGRHILTVSDRNLSSGGWLSSTDRAIVKIENIAPGWIGMFAGSVSSVVPIYDAVRKELHFDKVELETVPRPRHSLTEMMSTVKKSYFNQLFQEASDKHLGPLGMDWAEFKREGKKL